MLIKNARVVIPDGIQDWLIYEDSRILAIGEDDPPHYEGEILDAEGLTLLPGFIDIHVHGAVGYDTMDATPEAILAMAQFYAQQGVTSFLATTWTDSQAKIQKALENIAAMRGTMPQGATLLGAHLEGPYLNASKGGAQNTHHIRRTDPDEARAWLDLEVIRLLSLAPEFEENQWLITEAVKRGVTVSAAHTAATYEDMQKAVGLGLSNTTHTFNAMSALHHREPGVVGAALSMSKLTCELIADTIHVHPAVMDILWNVKGVDGIILITDAIRGTGMPDGEYPVDDRVLVVKKGSATLSDGTLAGSIITMQKAVYNFIQAVNERIETVWQVSSFNAAHAIGIGDHKGSLKVGKDADLVLVDDQMNVYLTIAEGQIVYSRG